jgi:hypothetical protein
MRQLVSAQEMYYGSYDAYLASAAMPTSIGAYLSPVPSDPGGGVVVACGQTAPAYVYCTIDNTTVPQQFCYYARLEQDTSKPYITGTHGGVFKKNAKPGTLTACAQPN